MPPSSSTTGRTRRFTEKEDRQAKHIAESERKRGKSSKVAKRIGYATVNKNKGKKRKTTKKKD
jgi:hypothetical protein